MGFQSSILFKTFVWHAAKTNFTECKRKWHIFPNPLWNQIKTNDKQIQMPQMRKIEGENIADLIFFQSEIMYWMVRNGHKIWVKWHSEGISPYPLPPTHALTQTHINTHSNSHTHSLSHVHFIISAELTKNMHIFMRINIFITLEKRMRLREKKRE